MMTKEEIEAIRLLNLCINSNAPLPEEALSWVKIVLNYIDKLQGDVKLYKDQADYLTNEYGDTIEELQKENKELRIINKIVKIAKEDLPDETEFIVLTKECFENNYNYISKDKIINKIKELEEGETIYNVYGNGQEYAVGKHIYTHTIKVLQELVEEE